MTHALPEPTGPPGDLKVRFLDYLDFYRSTITVKIEGLADEELRRTRLPSGWTPLELLNHLVHMERRWIRWGFCAEQVEAPWGDDEDGRWHVDPAESAGDLIKSLHEGGVLTRAVVDRAELDDVAAVGGRFAAADPPPTLAWILFHVLQEYARHAGHLDIVRELADGRVGE